MIAAEAIAAWRADPARMVRDLFGVTPDPWQAEALEAFPTTPRLVMKACKGPGKTALLAWLAWNFLLTRPNPMIGATSINADNLASGLWTELARWYGRSTLLQSVFDFGKRTISAKDPDYANTWKLEARTWARDAEPAQIGNALAGIHAKYVMWLLDEAGDYPDAIMPTCEGIFAGEPAEAHIVMAGNPTRLSGPLYRACASARKLWHVIEITADPDDPRRSSRISVTHAREQIEQYGRDNPWVLVNIFGKFPPSSLNALIGPDEVAAAQQRYYRDYEIGTAARVMGVDVAREGDDASVIYLRHGIASAGLRSYRNIDSTQGASQVARLWDDWQADGAVIDATGGFGAGWIDQLVRLGRLAVGVQFAAEAHQKSRYFNKRAEMYFEAVEWIKRGGALAKSKELADALTQTTYSFRGDRLILEPKSDIKARLGFSPDEADAFALTFAEPVAPRAARTQHHRRPQPMVYEPFAELDRAIPNPYRDGGES